MPSIRERGVEVDLEPAQLKHDGRERRIEEAGGDQIGELLIREAQRVGQRFRRREGRKRWNYLNAAPFKEIYDRWISAYANDAVNLLMRMKRDMEA